MTQRIDTVAANMHRVIARFIRKVVKLLSSCTDRERERRMFLKLLTCLPCLITGCQLGASAGHAWPSLPLYWLFRLCSGTVRCAKQGFFLWGVQKGKQKEKRNKKKSVVALGFVANVLPARASMWMKLKPHQLWTQVSAGIQGPSQRPAHNVSVGLAQTHAAGEMALTTS